MFHTFIFNNATAVLKHLPQIRLFSSPLLLFFKITSGKAAWNLLKETASRSCETYFMKPNTSN